MELGKISVEVNGNAVASKVPAIEMVSDGKSKAY